MPNPWLLALKVIPWGDVIEHAPRVLNAARKMVDRQREQRQTANDVPATGSTPGAEVASVSVQQLQSRLDAAHQRMDALLQAQDQLTQTVAELAEQNARLVAAVDVLRLRTRMLLVAAGVGAVALIALWLR
jgi:hypothetical protein